MYFGYCYLAFAMSKAKIMEIPNSYNVYNYLDKQLEEYLFAVISNGFIQDYSLK